MLDFPGFCYLDVQKTGSTFIRGFLLRNAREAPVATTEHARARPRKGVFYFSSCRDPLDQYRSLYAFGCAGRGAFHAYQVANDTPLAATYTGDRDGFRRWLALALSDGRAEYSAQGAARFHTPALGLMSLRFLRLNLRQPMRTLPLARTRALVDLLWRTRRLSAAVVRQETLRADLAALVRGPLAPHLRDVGAALEDLDAAPPENVSAGIDDGLAENLPAALGKRLRALEWFHYRHLGYR